MKIENTIIIIFVMLIVVIGLSIYFKDMAINSYTPTNASISLDNSGSSSVQNKSIVVESDRNTYQELEKEAEKIKFGRDPFYKKADSVQLEPPEEVYNLQGITWSESIVPVALLNGEVVSIGSVVGNVKVIDIQKNKLIIKKINPDKETNDDFVTLILPKEY